MDPGVFDVVDFEMDVGRDEGRLVRAKVVPDDLRGGPWLGGGIETATAFQEVNLEGGRLTVASGNSSEIEMAPSVRPKLAEVHGS